MKKLSLLLMVLAFATAMLAQSSDEKAEHAHKGKMGGGSGTLSGCLSGPNDEGAYVLTTSRGKKIEVGGTDDLKAHVGHEVKLTGTWAKSGKDIGEDEKKESAEKEKGERHFKVASVQHISPTCKQGAASGAGPNKKAPASKSAS
jgi:hypothetical protein